MLIENILEVQEINKESLQSGYDEKKETLLNHITNKLLTELDAATAGVIATNFFHW